MPTKITIDPFTRVEGHLAIEVTSDVVNSQQQVVDAKCSGTMFRGFEKIMIGRNPLDAPHLTQRICGVCPVSHGMASCMNIENAFGITVPENGRILRNLVLASNYIQSHILHFYHLAALDYIDTSASLDMSPWRGGFITDDMITGSTAEELTGHYVMALQMRRKAHQMGAIFGAKLPCSPVFVPGGCTEVPTEQKITDFRNLLIELRSFIDNIFIPDIQALADSFPQYYQVGSGCGNLLAYGVFDLNNTGSLKLLSQGRYTNSTNYSDVNSADITEYVKYAHFTVDCGNKNPGTGITEADLNKPDAYSWTKAPRYLNLPHETGPLARMWINGDYTNGISVLDRLIARALETKKIADAADGWLDEIVLTDPVYVTSTAPANATSIGWTEAPRGALGHWMEITNSVISRYQIVTPTAWNCSPADDFEQYGPAEQALIGTIINDITKPIELLRIIHSFDPCLACSVHMLRPGAKKPKVVIDIVPGAI